MDKRVSSDCDRKELLMCDKPDIVAFDTGRLWGWACGDNERLFYSGADTCGKSTDGMRVKLAGFREGVENNDELSHNLHEDTLIVYERSYGHLGTFAAQSYGSYIAILYAILDGRGQEGPVIGIHPIKLKQFATGDCRASKQDMIDAANKKWSGRDVRDDNQADAMWLWAFAASMYVPETGLFDLTPLLTAKQLKAKREKEAEKRESIS